MPRQRVAEQVNALEVKKSAIAKMDLQVKSEIFYCPVALIVYETSILVFV